MPQVIPAIVAYAASSAAVAAGISAFGAALIGAAASIVTSQILASALRPDDPASPGNNLAAPGGGRSQQVRQPISPHRIIAGRIKVSGPILFMHSGPDDDNRENGYMYIIHALCGHQTRAISDVFLDDNLSTASRYDGLVTVNLHTGEDDQVVDSTFFADIPLVWTANHRLRGITYLASRLKFDANAFPSGLPNISAIVEGTADITDFRDDVVRWTNNPALFISWWMMSPLGMNLTEDDLDLDSVIAAANVCDERIRVLSALDGSPPSADTTATVDTGSPGSHTLILADGARQLDYGYGVRVADNLPTGLSADTTYYVIPIAHNQIQLATSHINALDRIPISIGDPVGTISVYYWDEPRYLINGEFTVDQTRIDILQGMLSAMSGVAVYVGGKWFLHAGAPAVPAVTLSEDDLRGSMTMIPKRSIRDRFNIVRSVYVNPDSKWQPVDAPPVARELVYNVPAHYTITVGNGGAAQDGVGNGESGEDSIFDTITASGGGGGGDLSDAADGAGAAGGSGGGGGANSTNPFAGRLGGAGNTPSTSPSQGNNGGNGVDGGSGAGGGGGAGAVGANGAVNTGGNGGAGVSSSITGSSVTRAGGGGAGANITGGTGGSGGGANGAGGGANAVDAPDNLGGGGGGASSGLPSNGGSGVVVIRYVDSEDFIATGGTITTDGPHKIHTFTSSGTFTVTNGQTDVWYLVVGGGGGGSFGGGGAGGYRTNDAYDHTVSAGLEESLYRDFRFPFTTSGRAVQRLMKIELERNIRERTIHFPAKLTAFRLLPWDGMYLNHDRYGFEEEQHRVIGWKLSEEGGVDLSLQADDAEVYDWDRLTDEQTISETQDVSVPDGGSPSALVLTVVTPLVAVYTQLEVQWNSEAGVIGYDVYYKESGAVDWILFDRVETYNAVLEAPSFEPTDFRVRAVMFTWALGEFSFDYAPGPPTSTNVTGTTIEWTNDADADQVQVFKGGLDDFSASTLFTTVDGEDESVVVDDDFRYWLRSVSSSGNVSEETAMITVGSP